MNETVRRVSDHPGRVWPALTLYNLVFPIVFLLYFPFYLIKLQRRGNWREGYGERFGCFSTAKRAALSRLNRPIWLHAVSVGEVQAALRFIHDWQAEEPNLAFILSTTTATGQAIARKAASPTLVPVYCPLDWLPIVSRTLSLFKPAMVIIFEVEIWPSLIAASWSRGIPLALVNCRLSDRSAAGFCKRRNLFGPLFRRFSVIAAQSDEDAARVATIVGDAAAAVVCNTMKYDQVADPGALSGNALDSVLPAGAGAVFLGASTHPGEEAALGQAFCALRDRHPALCLVVVPRHAERAAAAVIDLQALGLTPRKLSDLRRSGDRSNVIVGDTTGELLALLAAADIVFVGKSFGDRRGGQNPIEPALLGKAVLHGPNMDNFRQVIADFRAADATIVTPDQAGLNAAVLRLLDNPAERSAFGERARATVAANRGAIRRTIQLLTPLLTTPGGRQEKRK